MPLIYHQGKPFIPPVIHGIPFYEDPDKRGIWLANVPNNMLSLFLIGIKGSPYALAVEDLSEELKLSDYRKEPLPVFEKSWS